MCRDLFIKKEEKVEGRRSKARPWINNIDQIKEKENVKLFRKKFPVWREIPSSLEQDS